MGLSRDEMDRIVNEHFGFEAHDDVEGVMASLAPEVEHEVVPSPVGVLHDTWLTSRRKGAKAPPLREGRRMRWLDTVLEPARGRVPGKQWQRLKAALALTLGMDAFIVMKDVCRLKDEEAQEVLR